MSKSILVIDTPENCGKCKFLYDRLFSACHPGRCALLVQESALDNSKSIVSLSGKPDWCPLRDLSEKMAEENRWFSKDYAEGFNTCVGEILKGDGAE